MTRTQGGRARSLLMTRRNREPSSDVSPHRHC